MCYVFCHKQKSMMRGKIKKVVTIEENVYYNLSSKISKYWLDFENVDLVSVHDTVALSTYKILNDNNFDRIGQTE